MRNDAEQTPTPLRTKDVRSARIVKRGALLRVLVISLILIVALMMVGYLIAS